MSYSAWLIAFQERQKLKHQPVKHFTEGYHPKHALAKKYTSFYPGCCHVLFDRKTIPKGGKNIQDGCFIKQKDHYHLIYDRETRALLGLDINKIKEYRRRFDESTRNFNTD